MELQLRRDDVAGPHVLPRPRLRHCNHTGYRGRMAIFEIMVLDDAHARADHAAGVDRRCCAPRPGSAGMRTLRESGLLAIYEGQTTIDEVVRETIIEE